MREGGQGHACTESISAKIAPTPTPRISPPPGQPHAQPARTHLRAPHPRHRGRRQPVRTIAIAALNNSNKVLTNNFTCRYKYTHSVESAGLTRGRLAATPGGNERLGWQQSRPAAALVAGVSAEHALPSGARCYSTLHYITRCLQTSLLIVKLRSTIIISIFIHRYRKDNKQTETSTRRQIYRRSRWLQGYQL